MGSRREERGATKSCFRFEANRRTDAANTVARIKSILQQNTTGWQQPESQPSTGVAIFGKDTFTKREVLTIMVQAGNSISSFRALQDLARLPKLQRLTFRDPGVICASIQYGLYWSVYCRRVWRKSPVRS